MESSNILGENYFPPKPQWSKKRNQWFRGLISLLLFIGSFYFLISDDLRYMAILIGVLFIHELGHFLAMKYYNYDDVRIFFVPLIGAVTTGKAKKDNQLHRSVILLSGPVPGILLGIALLIYGVHQEQRMVILIAEIFIFLNVFNLLPLIPLDGGRLIETLFLSRSSLLQLIFVILSSLVLIVIAFESGSKYLLIIPIFQLWGLIYDFTNSRLKKILRSKGINYNKPFEELTDEEYWRIRREMIQNMKAFNTLDENDFVSSPGEEQLASRMRIIVYPEPKNILKSTGKVFFVLIWISAISLPFLSIKQLEGRISLFMLANEKYREETVTACMEQMGELGVMYPRQTKDYCNCAFDTLSRKFSLHELKEQWKLHPEALKQLYYPHLELCRLRYKMAVEGDTVIVEFDE